MPFGDMRTWSQGEMPQSLWVEMAPCLPETLGEGLASVWVVQARLSRSCFALWTWVCSRQGDQMGIAGTPLAPAPRDRPPLSLRGPSVAWLALTLAARQWAGPERPTEHLPASAQLSPAVPRPGLHTPRAGARGFVCPQPADETFCGIYVLQDASLPSPKSKQAS